MKDSTREMLLILTLLAVLAPSAQAQRPGEASAAKPGMQQTSAPLRLEDLEQLALEHSPAIAEAAARVRQAHGRTVQAGLYPNPMVGYTGDEISSGLSRRGGEQGFFVEQEISTAGKLRLTRSVSGEEELQAAAEEETQKLRTLDAVRRLYSEALGAEKMVALRGQLAAITQEAVEISHGLANVGQADQPDVLEAEVEAQRAALALTTARDDRERVWRQLAAAVGVPALPASPLAGSLDDPAPEFDFDATLEELLRSSPEVKAAQSSLARAEQAEKRERAERIPNLLVRGGLRDNRELIEPTGRPVGLEGFAEVGVRIPLFNRNQGNLEAAHAERERAQQELARVQLVLRGKLAAAYRDYAAAKAITVGYRDQMLPRAQKAYELYLASYKQMAAAYPQVLIAERNLAQLQLDYLNAELALWQSVNAMRSMVVGKGFDLARFDYWDTDQLRPYRPAVAAR